MQYPYEWYNARFINSQNARTLSFWYFTVLDIIIGDSKSRVLGLSLSLAKPTKGVLSPIKTKRLQPSTNSGDTHATILVDGSNVQLITAMDSHPNRFITSFLTLQYNKSFYAEVVKMIYKLQHKFDCNRLGRKALFTRLCII